MSDTARACPKCGAETQLVVQEKVNSSVRMLGGVMTAGGFLISLSAAPVVVPALLCVGGVSAITDPAKFMDSWRKGGKWLLGALGK